MKEGWTYKKLGEVCDTINGLWKGKKPPFVNVGVIRNANFTKDFTLRFDNIEYLDVEERQYSKRKLQKGDLIVEKSGGSEKQPVGRAVLFDRENGEYSFSNFTSVLRVKDKNTLLSEFLYKFLLFIYKRGDTCTMQKATTGIHNIEFEKYLNLDVPCIPLAEQRSIVTRLDAAFSHIDALKANAEKQLNEARKLFQASLKEMLEPKEGWEEKAIKDFATDMYRGSGVKRDQVTEEGISCVRYGEIYTKYNFHFSKCASHTLTEYVNSPKYFEYGDILFAITGESVEEIGKSIAYTGKEKCIAGGDIVVMKHNYEPRYISYALSTPSAIKQKGHGKTKLKVVHTNIPSLKEIILPIAPKDEQIKISDTLDSLKSKVDRLQANYEKISQECDALKQALFRPVFE